MDGQFTHTGQSARTAAPAVGYSFAAGTTDGPGADTFLQGDATFDTEDASGGRVSGMWRRWRRRRWRARGAVATLALSGFKRLEVPAATSEAEWCNFKVYESHFESKKRLSSAPVT